MILSYKRSVTRGELMQFQGASRIRTQRVPISFFAFLRYTFVAFTTLAVATIGSFATATCPFNVSGNSTATALDDGLLLSRIAASPLDPIAVTGVRTARNADAIRASTAANEAKLDINANGAFDASDAGIVIRYLLGFRGDGLIPGGAGASAMRKTSSNIQNYLDGGCLASAPARKKLSEMPRTNGGVFISVLDDVEIDQDASLEWLEVQGSLVCTDRDLNLSAKWIIVHGGMLRCGTELNPFKKKFTVTLLGETSEEDALGVGMGTKVLGAMHGGKIDLHGEKKTSWTKITATAAAGATQINVLEATNWRVGDEIAIAPTDFFPLEAERRTISAINGTTLSLNAPFQHRHWGNIETLGTTEKTVDQRAEVALLTRNITIRSANSPGSQFGGHFMAMANAVARISNVEFSGLGQLQRVGRYPVHFHYMGDNGANSYLRDSAVHSSIQRGIVVHRSNHLRIQNNVVFDVTGHAVFLESAIETNNTFDNNLVMLVKMVPTAYRSTEFEFELFEGFAGAQLQNLKNRMTPAGFWISNQHNRFTNNVVAGVQFGYGYWFAEGEMSSIRDVPNLYNNGNIFQGFVPSAYRRPFLQFEGNSAHSINAVNDVGRTTQYASPMSAGLFFESLSYFPEIPGSAPIFKDFTVWKVAHTGVWAQTFNLQGLPYEQITPIIDGLVAADNRTALFVEQGAGPTRIRNSVLYGFTNNITPGRTAPEWAAQWTPFWRSLSHSFENVDIHPIAASPNSLRTTNDITPAMVLGLRANDGKNTPVFLEFSNVQTKGWPDY
jgi:hypothetical protein